MENQNNPERNVISNYQLEINPQYRDFKSIEVVSVDETKPWKPALKVDVTNPDESKTEGVDASTPYCVFKAKNGKTLNVSLEAAGHIDKIHIKGEDLGSKFDNVSFESLMKDMAEKIPENIVDNPGVDAFSIEMGKSMGKEGIASMENLKADGILSDTDISLAKKFEQQVTNLNKEVNNEEKNEFIKTFLSSNPDSKIQFQLIRNGVLVPKVDAPKRPTTQLFMVFGPGANGEKTLYTVAPGRNMPKHPDPAQHLDEKTGMIDNNSFQESATAWFNTVQLTGK